MKKLYVILILILVVVILFIARESNNTEVPTVNENNKGISDNIPTVMEKEKTSEIIIEDVKEFIVTGKNFSFDPKIIKVNKGDRVKIVFKNIQGFHDLVIDEFGIATKKTQAPTEEVVEFIADKIGSFEYYCSIGSHRQMGMKGVLEITS